MHLIHVSSTFCFFINFRHNITGISIESPSILFPSLNSVSLTPIRPDELIVFYIKIKNVFDIPVQFALKHDEGDVNSDNNNNNNKNDDVKSKNEKYKINNYNKIEKGIEDDILTWHKFFIADDYDRPACHSDSNSNGNMNNNNDVNSNNNNDNNNNNNNNNNGIIRGTADGCGLSFLNRDRTLNSSYIQNFYNAYALKSIIEDRQRSNNYVHKNYTNTGKNKNNKNFCHNNPVYSNLEKLKSRFFIKKNSNNNGENEINSNESTDRFNNNNKNNGNEKNTWKKLLKDNQMIEGVSATVYADKRRTEGFRSFQRNKIFIHPLAKALLVRNGE